MGEHGFILQPTYRIERGQPVVCLFGKLEDGGGFLVRDDRSVPCFYIAHEDAERAEAMGAEVAEAADINVWDGRPAARVVLRVPSDAPPLRDRLLAVGIPCFEADVRFASRFLIDRRIHGTVEIFGPSREVPGIGRVFHNPRLRSSDRLPRLDVLSFDIETDPRARRLLSIALHGSGAEEVLIFSPSGYPAPPGTVGFASERELLQAFCARVRELDPDVLTGWNVIDFDLRVLARLAADWRLPLELGRGSGQLRLRETRAPWGQLEAQIPGRVVLDGIRLLRGAFVKMDEYGLDAVGRQVLGRGKTLAPTTTSSGGNRAQDIVHAFLHERERFAEYNLNDARLVSEILDELRLIALSVERSRLTGLPIDRVSGSIAAFDFLYLGALAKRGIAAPSVSRGVDGEANLGGQVLRPEPGLYQNVVVLDFKSLYPSLIRTFQIDPLGYLPDPDDSDDPVVAPNGAAFRRAPGLLTEMLDRLFPEREAAKEAGDTVKSHAIKILMNSFYGVLGTSGCRFYDPRLAGAITAFGRELLLWSKRCLEGHGYRVLYGDTDSLFVLTGVEDPKAAWRVGEELAIRLDHDLAAHIEETWGVESRLEAELERLYLRLLLPPMRGGRGGARKRYAGLIERQGRREVVFTGMENVRRDWTELAKEVQRQLYERLFDERPVEAYLRRTVRELREGGRDDQLVYLKGLRKPLESYTATTPPHVAAARKQSRPPSKIVRYVQTTGGPEPADERRHPFDYEHYVDKQIRPVAEPVLAILGLELDRVVGDNAQLGLFDEWLTDRQQPAEAPRRAPPRASQKED